MHVITDTSAKKRKTLFISSFQLVILHTCNRESTYMYQIQYMHVMKKVQGCNFTDLPIHFLNAEYIQIIN